MIAHSHNALADHVVRAFCQGAATSDEHDQVDPPGAKTRRRGTISSLFERSRSVNPRTSPVTPAAWPPTTNPDPGVIPRPVRTQREGTP